MINIDVDELIRRKLINLTHIVLENIEVTKFSRHRGSQIINRCIYDDAFKIG